MSTQRPWRVALSLFALLCGVGVQSGRAGWIQGAGAYDFTNAANWAGGLIDGQFTNTLSGNLTLRFPVDTTIATNLEFFHKDSRTVSFISGDGSQRVYLPDAITCRTSNTTWGVTALLLGNSVSGAGAFDMVLRPDTVLTLDLVGAQGGQRAAQYARFCDDGTNRCALRLAGDQMFYFQNSNSFTGPLTMGGSLDAYVGDYGSLATTTVVVNATSFIIDNWGRYPDATSSGRVMTNRIADGAAVSLVSGASLSLWGGPRTLASSNEIAEHIGSLIFDKGANSVAVRYAYAEGTAGQTSGPVRLEAASVAVSNGAVVRLYGGDHAGGSPLNLGGTGLSSSAFIVMDTSTVGAVNGMVPWTYFCVGSSPCYSRYAVYDSVLGFRPFVNDADDQVGFQDAMPSSNVRLTNDTTLASSTNINSLTILATNALVVTNAPGVGIRIESGALMFNLASTTWFRPRLYPDLDFAGRHGYVYFMASTAGGGDLWISGKLTNIASDGISFSGLSAAGVITLGETVEIRNWTGPVYVNTCRLRISGGVGPTNVPLHVMAGAEMLYHISSPFRVYIRSLSGAGKVYGRGTGDAGITAVAYYIGDNSDTAFDGTLYSSEDVPAGRATLRKVGSGTWTFNGVNACTGSTTVAEGALVINGSFATNATVSVNDASVLAGNGRIGNLLLQAGATVAPGAARSNAVGQLNVSGNATWTTNAIYQWEINNALGQAGSSSGWDLVSAGGTLNITATAGQPCTVKIVGLTAAGLSGAPTNFLQQRTYSWKIASADSISGFSADKFQLDRAGFVAIGRFTITASGSQGTGLYLTYAPPPGTVFAIH